MSFAEIEQMSTVERVQAMERLWDALVREKGDIEPPDWHEAILEERVARMDSPDAKFLTLEQLRDCGLKRYSANRLK